MIALVVNGRKHTVDVSPDTPLLWVIRENLGLTGTKYGCGEARCGTCAVLVDGQRILSCHTPVGRVEGKSVVTIEGLAPEGKLHPVQEAFLEEGAFQCGYCTPGMVVTTVDLLARTPDPSEEQIRGLQNLCRCCGYPKIAKAVRNAAARMKR